ncbi:MAG: tRNA (adenosine(37)-N6)-threonylcarbamoyltransferase complex ATPase subunit type 1 TsaE [Candidatus Anoxymicrobium japonicum]|uniref:tRNA threonylcarbamoyladenosine biosynthesis protein TsaE n=1 Tax=Candidatus Anoxymicrobium japonicum TaxID=2013648 RepID=A0A2N3G485_9ACTN|nr:MAG: tRNA (adenosine(37)-N6)-threonylcarbamoyltransferase complex ATPase subunit type 1 TsaE [Candidatus Anoxymicrobium japonicum]
MSANGMVLTLKTLSEEQSAEVGAFLGGILEPGDVLCLEGGLGVGKTAFVRGLARGKGYKGFVTSPTFTIINQYPEIGLCHVDAYRLTCARELLEVGIEEFLCGEWVCAVEWAARVRGALPDRALEVRLTFGAGEDERLLEIAAAAGWDGRWRDIEERLCRYA